MREATAAVALTVMSCVPSVGGDQSAPSTSRLGWIAALFERPSWDAAVARVDSPKRAAKLARLYVRFEEETEDEWTDGKSVWERGFGDCEDFAAVVVQLCREAGIDADASIQVFTVNGVEGHAVALGQWRGRMWISSNGWFEFVDSMDDARLAVRDEMDWYGQEIASVPLEMVNRSSLPVASASAAP